MSGIASPLIITAVAFVPIVIRAVVSPMFDVYTSYCSFQLFRWMILSNERRLARLTHHVKRHSDEYSLSLRLQLKENVWSMRVNAISVKT